MAAYPMDVVSNAYQLSRYVEVVTAPKRLGAQDQILLFSTRSGRFLAVQPAIWHALVHADVNSLSKEIQDQLRDAEILVPSIGDERFTLAEKSRNLTLGARTLTRYILPTAFCQLGCSYCGQEHTAQVMDRNLMDKLVAEIGATLHHSAFDRLFVTWFGGEPTTVPGVVSYLSERLIGMCRDRNLLYESRMVTNGLALSVPLAQLLVKSCNVGMFIVSLDGPERIHDTRRQTKVGHRTFNRILSNVKQIADSSELSTCRLRIRINIDQNNAQYVHELIEELAALGLAARLEIDFAVVVPWSIRTKSPIIDRCDFADMEIGWLAHLVSRGFKPDLLPAPKASACLAAEPFSATVSPDGVLHNCAMTPLAPQEITRTTEPLGTLDFADSRHGIDRHQEIFRLVYSSERPCRECKYLFLCQGSCPKDLEKGIVNCPSYKFNLSSRMSLLYLDQCRRDRSAYSEPEFAFSGLDLASQHLLRESVISESARFQARFALFRMPDFIHVIADGASQKYEIVEIGPHYIRWNHKVPSNSLKASGPTIDIVEELAQCYVAQVNPQLFKLFQQGEDLGALRIVRGFVDWAGSVVLNNAKPCFRDQVRDIYHSIVDSIARQACVDQFLAQPVDRVLSIVRDLFQDRDLQVSTTPITFNILG